MLCVCVVHVFSQLDHTQAHTAEDLSDYGTPIPTCRKTAKFTEAIGTGRSEEDRCNSRIPSFS